MIKAPRNRIKKSEEEFYAPVPLSPAGTLDRSTAARLLDAFLAGRKAETIKAYRADLEDFRAFVQPPRSTTPPRDSHGQRTRRGECSSLGL
jgi:hypothetical protein